LQGIALLVRSTSRGEKPTLLKTVTKDEIASSRFAILG
jgi:hypothetical protein